LTKEEYDKRQADLLNNYNKDKRAINKEYVESNNPVHIGDFVSDGTCSIRVDAIRVYNSPYGYPVCRYDGALLTKKGVPHKTGRIDVVWQNALISINGELYDGAKNKQANH